MKLSEFKVLVDKYHERAQRSGEDPEVVIETAVSAVPTRVKIPVKMAMTGGDWTRGFFMIFPTEQVVPLRTENMSLDELAQKELDSIKDNYAKLGQEYIKKVRESEWIVGFKRGFQKFGTTIK